MELDDEKLSFSKKVVGTVTWLFVGIIMFSAGTWLIYREIPDRLIDYVDGPFSVIISGYFAKASRTGTVGCRSPNSIALIILVLIPDNLDKCF